MQAAFKLNRNFQQQEVTEFVNFVQFLTSLGLDATLISVVVLPRRGWSKFAMSFVRRNHRTSALRSLDGLSFPALSNLRSCLCLLNEETSVRRRKL